VNKKYVLFKQTGLILGAMSWKFNHVVQVSETCPFLEFHGMRMGQFGSGSSVSIVTPNFSENKYTPTTWLLYTVISLLSSSNLHHLLYISFVIIVGHYSLSPSSSLYANIIIICVHLDQHRQHRPSSLTWDLIWQDVIQRNPILCFFFSPCTFHLRCGGGGSQQRR
jgi:hypothetical protein